jgi:hypothetical protein
MKTDKILDAASTADAALSEIEFLVPSENKQEVADLRKQLAQVIAKALASSNI